MPTELLRDVPSRANGALGSPDFGPAYTVLGTPPVVSGGIVQLQGTRSISSGVKLDTGKTNHGVWAKIRGQVTGSRVIWMAVRSTPTSVISQSGSYSTAGPGFYLRIDASGILVGISTAGANPGPDTYFNGGSYIPNSGVGDGDTVGIYCLKTWILVFVNGRLVYFFSDNRLGTNTCVGVWGTSDSNQDLNVLGLQNIRIDTRQASYPTHGMPRFAYDRDGTVGVAYAGGTAPAAADMLAMNNTNDQDSFSTVDMGNPHGFVLLFPEARDIWAFHLQNDWSGRQWHLEVSYDTTTGNDGTWTNVVLGTNGMGVTNPDITVGELGWRMPNLRGLWSGVRAVRSWAGYGYANAVRTLHIYGRIPETTNVHRVEFWHPYLDLALPGDYLDMDDVLRGATVTREFRIRNGSGVYTMNNIVLDVQSPEYGTALTNDYSIKRASQGAYGPNTTVASLAPGAISEIISVRRIVAAGATYRVDAPRVRSQIGSLA